MRAGEPGTETQGYRVIIKPQRRGLTHPFPSGGLIRISGLSSQHTQREIAGSGVGGLCFPELGWEGILHMQEPLRPLAGTFPVLPPNRLTRGLVPRQWSYTSLWPKETDPGEQ